MLGIVVSALNRPRPFARRTSPTSGISSQSRPSHPLADRLARDRVERQAMRDRLLDWYGKNRERTRRLFDLLSDDAYYSQPIALRHPIVFYEGHLPAFSFNTLVKKALGGAGIDARLETLFARGIDPHESSTADSRESRLRWPSRAAVRAFEDEADRRVVEALSRADLDRPGDPLLAGAEAAYSILEHEAMHQETLLYIWHRLPINQKKKPAGYQPRTLGKAPGVEWITVPPGRATLGVDRGEIAFGWDNEFPALSAEVAELTIERHNVTNGRYLEFVTAGGYDDPQWWDPDDWQWIRSERRAHPLFWERVDGEWYWRGMFDLVALPPAWPVYVSLAEARAFAKWC